MRSSFSKFHQLFCTFTLSVLLLTACGGTVNGVSVSSSVVAPSSTTSQVVVAISTEPEHGFDPTLGWGHSSTPLVQSTLVKYTQDMQIVNDLATEYDVSPDGLVWSFTIREDAHFTDGTQLTAADVAYTFNTAKASQSSLDLTFMQSCKAIDDFAISFTLTAPTSTFIHTIATIGIVPQHAHNSRYAIAPIGSGPWKLVQWNKGEQIILEANPTYYGAIPSIGKVTLVFMDEDAAFAAAQSGQVDVALVSATQANAQINGMHLAQISTTDNRGITMPLQPAGTTTTQQGYPVGNDVTSQLSIRHALAYGIDRAQLAQDALGGFGDPAYSENDGMPWNNPAVKIETDIAKAQQLLAEDGWQDVDNDGILEKNGIKASFTCLYPSGDSVRQAVAMAAAQQARELGIDIIVRGESWDEISKNMFSNAVLMGWGSSNPYESYLLYHSTNALREDYYNPEGLQNSTIDTYLEAALHAIDPQDAYTQWQLAQWDGTTGTSMQGLCPWVWLVNVQHLYYVRDGLDIGAQQLHPHGASWPLLQNLTDWAWT